jgi:DNA mismatch repair ATPase MutS
MHVAKLAGLSQELVRRAEAKSRELEASQKAVFARNLFARLSSLLSKAEAEAGQSGEVWQQVLADLASAKQQAHGSLA